MEIRRHHHSRRENNDASEQTAGIHVFRPIRGKFESDMMTKKIAPAESDAMQKFAASAIQSERLCDSKRVQSDVLVGKHLFIRSPQDHSYECQRISAQCIQ